MRKFILIILLFTFIGGLNQSFSAWYGTTATSYSNSTPTMTSCSGDGDTTGGTPTGYSSDIAVSTNNDLVPDPVYNTYSLNSNQTNAVAGATTTGTMYCLSWDGSNPESLSVSYTAGWTNSAKTITVKSKDRGGSKLKKMVLQQSQNGGVWTDVSTWDNLNAQDTIITKTWTRNVVNGSNFKYRLIAYDYAGNSTIVTNTNLIKFDTTAPTFGDVSSSISSTDYLNANNTQSIIITVGVNGGSPITQIDTDFEKESDKTTYYTKNGTSSPFITTYDISNVDLNINLNNYRDYTHNITKVCDEAGNCTNDIKTFTYHVLAGNIDNTKSSITGTGNFTGGDEVADGNEKILTVKLRDAYDNEIVPVYKSGGTTKIRDIELTGTYNNSLYLNQLNNSGIGVELTGFDTTTYNNSIIGTNETISTTIINKNNNDGDYDLKFKVYAPTYYDLATDGRQFAKGNFTINNIKGDVSDITGKIELNSAIDFQFKPLIDIENEGELLNKGLIEGRTQTGKIIINNNSNVSITNETFYLSITGSLINEFTGTGQIDDGTEKGIGNNLTEFLTSFNYREYIIKTLFILTGSSGFIDDIKNIKLNQYIKYTIGDKTVTYLVGILNNNNNNQIFETLKIYGITNIDASKQRDLTLDQNITKIQNLNGDIVKSSLKRDIRKSAISTVKFIDGNIDIRKNIMDLKGNIWDDTNNGGKALGNILYYDNLNGDNVELGNGIDLTIEGKKTIIIKGGNLRIKSNILNASIYDILGIIVLKDENGKGGKIYIDTNVQKIDAIIYADKSLISYNISYNNGSSNYITKHEIDGLVNNTMMSNQLYIFGTVFSENTIGGSKLNPPICPFWTKLDSINCDLIEAQKYDLNYLRGGYNNKYDSNYGDYPIIIKYNSNIQSGPPPLFRKQ